jgi:hypothetical protein
MPKDNPKMHGNVVVDEELSEVERNQANTFESRLARLEDEVFPPPSEDEDEKPSSPPSLSSKTAKKS